MIVLIAANNLYCSPYVDIYREVLDVLNLDYRVIFMNRENLPEEETQGQRGMPWKSLFHRLAAANKLYNYLRYRRFVLKLIKGYDANYLIFFTAAPAFLLADRLISRYRGRFAVDIRDFSHENLAAYRLLERFVFSRAAMTSISSPAYTCFLPKKQPYVLCHNVTAKKIRQAESTYRFTVKKSSQIIIGYIGLISYPETCIALARLVSRDPRFAFHLYGEDTDGKVTEYVSGLQADNVRMAGRYRPDEKAGICEKVDILFNAYGYGNPLLDTAVSNKYYDAILYRKPVVNSPGTFMHRSLEPISFAYDHRHMESLDAMYAWYLGLSPAAADAFCLSAVTKLKRDIQNFSHELAGAIKPVRDLPAVI